MNADARHHAVSYGTRRRLRPSPSGLSPAVLSFPLRKVLRGPSSLCMGSAQLPSDEPVLQSAGISLPACVEAGLPFHRSNPATSSRFMLLHRGNSRLNGRGAFPYRQRVPRSLYCWKSAVEPSDFHMKRKGLAASCGESIRAGLDGLGACPSVRPGSEGGSWGGVRFRGFVLRSVQRDPAGRIGRLAACAAAGDEVRENRSGRPSAASPDVRICRAGNR